ncbi:MAG: type II secretion system F family protein [Micrococcaceae bacterium]|nr:type II secretion system F family protein [Micrococcaceae bacterium]
MVLVAALLAGMTAWWSLAVRRGPWAGPGPAAGPAPGAGKQASGAGDQHPTTADVPLLLELAATLLDAGLPVNGVLATLAREVAPCRGLQPVVRCLDLGIDWQRAWQAAPAELLGIGEALAFAHLTGAATSGLLRSAADQARRSEARRTEKEAAELGVKMVIPLGVCALPAFICLGIVPVVMALLPALG